MLSSSNTYLRLRSEQSVKIMYKNQGGVCVCADIIMGMVCALLRHHGNVES